MIADTRSSSFAIGAAVVAAAIAVAALGTCGAPRHATAPSIAWDGRALTAVWERSDGHDNTTVFVHRFAGLSRGVSTIGTGTPIYSHQKYAHSWDRPEIASDATSSLVIMLGSPGNFLALPLDANGAVAGPAQPLTSCSSDRSERVCGHMCRRPVPFGDGFAFGYVSAIPRAGRAANGVSVTFLSRDGKTVRDVALPVGVPSGCALASTGSHLVVAIAEARPGRKDGIQIQIVDEAVDSGPWIPGAERAIALVWTGVDLVLLYEMHGGPLRVVHIDERGAGEPVTLPADVDPATVDLGVGAHGPFVTWIAGGRVFVRDVATAETTRSSSRGAQPLGTRALVVADRCVAAWTAAGGAKLGVLSTACP